MILHRKGDKKFGPNRWEFVSAFVEDNPGLQEYAQKQVGDETGLEVKFVRRGADFTVFDEYGEWLIHPFLFEARSENAVLRPADHTEFKWVSASETNKYETVKDLEKNLRALHLGTNNGPN